MNATVLYRISAVLLILFAAAHTFGFLSFVPPTADGRAVLDAMNNVHFQSKGHTYTYGNFYRGFGLFVTAYLLFAALVAWQMGSLAAKVPQAIGVLGWAFFALMIVSMAISWIYIAAPPAVSSALVAVCLAVATWKVKNGKARAATIVAAA